MPSTNVWYCCGCGFGPCNSFIDQYCPNCQALRCTGCKTTSIRSASPTLPQRKTSNHDIKKSNRDVKISYKTNKASDRNIKILDQNVNISDQNAEASDQRSTPPSAIFSLPTMPSTALTANSVVTHGEMRQAVNELAIILMEDHELEKLFITAMNDKRISPDRFARNFKRLLKLFARDLKQEIREAADLELARFVSSKAGLVPAVVRQKLEPRRGNVKEPQIEDGPLDKEIMDVSTDDEAPEEEAKNQNFVALVAHGRTFIEKSAAFRELRKNFGNFLNSQSGQNILHESTIESESQSETSSNMSPTSLFQKFQRNVWALLCCITLRESHIPPGHQRIRWINVCSSHRRREL